MIDLSEGQTVHPFGTFVYVHLLLDADVTVTALVEGRRHAHDPWEPVARLTEATPEPFGIVKAYPEMRAKLSRLSGGVAALVMIQPGASNHDNPHPCH